MHFSYGFLKFERYFMDFLNNAYECWFDRAQSAGWPSDFRASVHFLCLKALGYNSGM
jgi:hypothetical protein